MKISKTLSNFIDENKNVFNIELSHKLIIIRNKSNSNILFVINSIYWKWNVSDFQGKDYLNVGNIKSAIKIVRNSNTYKRYIK